jgi:pentapeptide MXKDX repeat protein
MFQSVRAGLRASLLLALVAAGSAAAQDSTMKHEAMPQERMAKDSMMMGQDGMAHDKMMSPHGIFGGAHGHKVSGSYTVTTVNGHEAVQLGEDFSLDGAPDPYVVLSEDEAGSGAHVLNLGALKRRKGSSTFAIPAGTDLAAFHHVLIWCKKFNVTLGLAALAMAGAKMHN